MTNRRYISMSHASDNKAFENFPDDSMVEVPKDFFFDGMPLPASVFLKLKPGHYLLIGKKGDKAAFSKLHVYNRPDTVLFVKNTEYIPLIQQVTGVTERVLKEKSVPDAVKLKFLSGLCEDAAKSLEKSGFTTVAKTQKVSQMLMAMAQQMPAFDEVLKILENLPPSSSKHGMTTCLISMLVCEEIPITLPLAQEKVALGSLLHDIGLNVIPKAILEKPKHLWTPEELNTYEQHPLKGIEILREVKDIPSDVILIIAEHHENAQGTGFPKRMRDIKISPLARIVALANYFANLLFDERTGEKHYSPDEAVKYIEDILGQPFNKQAFLALKNIINKKYLADKI